MFTPHPLSRKYLAQRPVLGLFACADPVDDWQRPLLEWASIAHKASVARACCPYGDTRAAEGTVMNIAALRALTCGYPQVLCELRRIATFLPPHKRHVGLLERVWQLSDLACSRVSHPVLLALVRGQRAATLDGAACALQKICRGLRHVCELAMSQQIRFSKDSFARAFYDFADTHGMLIGASEVCAAPPAMIRSFLSSLLDALEEPGPSAGSEEGVIALEFQRAVHGARSLTFIYEGARVLANQRARGIYVDDCRDTFPASRFAHECARSSESEILDHALLLLELNAQLAPIAAGTRMWASIQARSIRVLEDGSPHAWAYFQRSVLQVLNRLNASAAHCVGSRATLALDAEDLELFFGTCCAVASAPDAA